MGKMTKEQKISHIIAMEERITNCTRCASQRRCVSKPSLGKGDLDPDIMLVFQSQSNAGIAIKKIIEIRQLLKKDFSYDKIYHTFLVRCQPKACINIDNLNCVTEKYLIDHEQNCRFIKTVCEGIPILPGDKQILSCLHYLIEEIDILLPQIIILFGSRTANFVLKAMGFLDSILIPGLYIKKNQYIFTTVEENKFTNKESKKLASFITSDRANLA